MINDIGDIKKILRVIYHDFFLRQTLVSDKMHVNMFDIFKYKEYFFSKASKILLSLH